MKLSKLYKKPYVYWLVGIFLVYIIVLTLISGFYNNIPLVIIYAKTLNWFKLGLSFLFSIVIGVLVAMNSVLLYLNYKQRRECKKSGAAATLGTLGGLATGVCPICVTGIVPLILSFLGISFTFALLPFNGLEVQGAVIIILIISLRSMNRNI